MQFTLARCKWYDMIEVNSSKAIATKQREKKSLIIANWLRVFVYLIYGRKIGFQPVWMFQKKKQESDMNANTNPEIFRPHINVWWYDEIWRVNQFLVSSGSLMMIWTNRCDFYRILNWVFLFISTIRQNTIEHIEVNFGIVRAAR